MKTYLITTFIIALLIATTFILLVSEQNLGQDFYATTMENGAKIERPRFDQFALYIVSWTLPIFVVFAAPPFVFNVCRLVVRKLK